MNNTHVVYSARHALVAAILVFALGVSTFFVLEPSVGRSATETFEVTQTVSGAIAFFASSTPVSMSPALDGLTGGTSYGSTTARVRTNNALGYNMSITFASTAPMVRNGGSGAIATFLYSTSTFTYPAGFTTSVANAQFGFTVNASTTEDVATVFHSSAGLCGTSVVGSFTFGTCWRGASSTNIAASTLLINRSTPTPPSGSTSTVQFRITIPNNPSPVVPDGTYTATATLTATDN